MPGYHTPKEKRKAAQIAHRYRMSGVPKKKATRWAWATVNSGRRRRRG
jgi:hypothetical protein